MEYDPELDALLSYEEGMRAIGERVKAGEPVPEFLKSKKDTPRLCQECGRPMRPRHRESPQSFAKKVVCGMKCGLTRYERARITQILVEGAVIPAMTNGGEAP